MSLHISWWVRVCVCVCVYVCACVCERVDVFAHFVMSVCVCVCVSTITRTLPFSFRLFHRFANFLFFFDYNTDFAIFAYLRDWFFEDLSVTHYFWANFDHFSIKHLFEAVGEVLKISRAQNQTLIRKFRLSKSVKRFVRATILARNRGSR